MRKRLHAMPQPPRMPSLQLTHGAGARHSAALDAGSGVKVNPEGQAAFTRQQVEFGASCGQLCKERENDVPSPLAALQDVGVDLLYQGYAGWGLPCARPSGWLQSLAQQSFPGDGHCLRVAQLVKQLLLTPSSHI